MMKVKKILAIIFGVIAIAINVLIIVESFIGGFSSSQQSAGFTQIIINVLNAIGLKSLTEDPEALHAFIRKLFGHFLLFGLSGIFTSLSILLSTKEYKGSNWLFMAIAISTIGISMAIISEFIQFFVPDRAGMISDVAIDSGGYLLFAGIVYLFFFIVVKVRKR